MRFRAQAALVVVAALALAGCGGIPTSGPVQSGAIIDEDLTPDFGFLPPGPQPGATPTEIVSGFVQAATNPQDDYAVARQFLSGDVASDWEPNEITQIRAGSVTPRDNGDNTFTMTFSSSAYVDATGRYIEEAQSTQALGFTVEQDEDGEWRIVAAPNGIVLSAESFTTIFEKHALHYYYGTGFEFLVPDVRWFPRSSLLPTSLVRALLAGQSGWLGSGVTSTEFPTGTTLTARVGIDAGVATVELSEEATSADTISRIRMRDQLAATLEVSTVRITVNGVELEIPEADVPPVTEPTVQGQLLALGEDGFGYVGANGTITPLDGIGEKVVDLGGVAATLAPDRDFAAVLAADGAVYRVTPGAASSLIVDQRPGLSAPATDAQGFVWSIPSGDASAIRAVDSAGRQYTVANSIPAGTRLSGFALSRDGSRIALYVSTDSGTDVLVHGILRNGGVPTQLGESFGSLRIDQSLIPRDVAWVDSRTIAVLAAQEGTGTATVTAYELGGPSEAIGRVPGGVSIVGGNSGTDGLRVMAASGEVYRPRGSGWSSTTSVSFIATQQ